MLCSVKAPKVSLAVTWKFEPYNSTAQKNIICMDNTGSTSCGAEQQDYHLETQARESGTDFILNVFRASKRQEGKYKCQIDAYDRNVQKTKKQSNPLAITIRRPGRRARISNLRPLKCPKTLVGVLETPVLHILVHFLFLVHML